MGHGVAEQMQATSTTHKLPQATMQRKDKQGNV
jgi:hypothetical protein